VNRKAELRRPPRVDCRDLLGMSFAVGTHSDGTKTVDLLGKSRIHLSKSDAKFMAGLLIRSKRSLDADSVKHLSVSRLLIADSSSKNRKRPKLHLVTLACAPKERK
jgi:hypothetical protein